MLSIYHLLVLHDKLVARPAWTSDMGNTYHKLSYITKVIILQCVSDINRIMVDIR
jgi:hypothetical protein